MDFSQKNGIGLIYIKDILSPSSPFGKEKLRDLEIYCSAQKQQLSCELDNLEKAVEHLRNTPSAFNLIKHIFSQTKDIRRSIKRLQEAKTLDELELFEIKRFADLSMQAYQEFERLNTLVSFADISLYELTEVHSILSSNQSQGFMISSDLSQKLANIRCEKARINKRLALCVDDQERKTLMNTHLSVAVEEQKEEAVIREMLSAKLMPYATRIQKNIESITTLDLLIEKAQLAVLNNCVKPVITDYFSLVDAVNPQILSRLEKDGNTFTPISISGTNGVTVITGANMGGKTTALKTVALNVYLALCGFFVFAKEACIPMFDFIDIISDNLQAEKRGLSSFGGEIVRLDALYKQAKTNFGLILFDEFASGTNADEGIRLFNATVKAFNKCNTIVFMTTHYDNATRFAKSHYQVNGLRNADFNTIERKLCLDKSKSNEIIAQFMDYGLIKVDNDTKIPKDAITIAQMLRLDADILNNLE